MAETKQTPELALAAENAALRQEIDSVEVQIPNYTPYAGPLPESVEAFKKLPKPWREQLARENPGLLDDLMNRQIIKEQMADMNKVEAKTKAKIAQVLKEVPFKTWAEYEALPAKEQARWQLTTEQRRALVGDVDVEAIENTL